MDSRLRQRPKVKLNHHPDQCTAVLDGGVARTLTGVDVLFALAAIAEVGPKVVVEASLVYHSST